MATGKTPSGPDPDRLITVTLPWSHWSQIVRDIEDMCGRSDDIEILSAFTVTDPAPSANPPSTPTP